MVIFLKIFLILINQKGTPTQKDSWWLTGLNFFKKQSLAAISSQGPLMRTALQGEACSDLPASALNSCCRCSCHLSQPDKGVPGLLFLPTGQSFPLPIRAVQLQPTRVALFWPIRRMPFEPIKLQSFGVLICMRIGQSGTRPVVHISQLPSG